ncbi:MAG: ABC transporter permease [Alphaproteobacteria bacterium]|nr:ABC transporter permease [Alphaproteobacteria bacterium]
MLAGLRHHQRVAWGLLATAALTSALLGGGLAMGDALRAALAHRVDERLGPVDVVVEGGDEGVRVHLAQALGETLGVPTAAVALRPAVASTSDGATAALTLLGADARFLQLAPGARPPPPGAVRLSLSLQDRLGVVPGDRIALRVERPSALASDVALAQATGLVTGLSLQVAQPLDGWPAHLGLRATPGVPEVALVDLESLGRRLAHEGRADAVLVAGADEAAVSAALPAAVSPADGGIQVRRVRDELVLSTARVVLAPPVVAAVRAAVPEATPGLVWLVDELAADGRSVPYVFVGATPAGPHGTPMGALLPADLGAEEIVLTDVLAADLGVVPGSRVQVRFPVLGAHRTVTHEQRWLVVRAVVPLAGAAADPSWMPPIEGLEDAETCAEWDPGLPVDLERIRPEDEAYWAAHKGTPRAWVALETGRRLWAGALGDTTTLRMPATAEAALQARLREVLEPAVLGVGARSVRGQLEAAAAPANDFGVLFASFDGLLVIAALVLAGLQAALGLVARQGELGTLRALGWTRGRVLGLVVGEAAVALGAGALLGVPLAALVAWTHAEGLAGVWATATSGVHVPLVLRPATLLGAGALAFVASTGAVAATARGLVGRPPRALLAGVDPRPHPRTARRATAAAVLLLGAAVVLALSGPAERTPEAALRFFGAGSLVLVAGLAAVRAWLGRPGSAVGPGASARRPGRALAVVGVLALGTFLVAGVGLGAGRAPPSAREASSGSGGFALWVHTTLGVPEQLDSAVGRERFDLEPDLLPDGSVVGLLTVEGDDASCLQLGSAQTPTLHGVDPEALARRGSFGHAVDWAALRRDLGPGRLAAVGDEPTVTWGLHAGVGDVLTWVDEQGRELEVELVGVIGSSVLQGGLLVDADALRPHFPTRARWTTFLVDAPPSTAPELARALGRALSDHGVVVQPTEARLAAFAAVEDTYVAIFRALGGLGLVLGGAGVGLLLARAVLEREGELALLRALGFPRGRVRRLLVVEHGALVATGLALGLIASLVAVAPVLRAADADPPWGSVAAVLLGTAAVAWAALELASARALAGVPLRALVRERR